VKLFLEPRAAPRHARRETEGLGALARAGLAAPRVMHAGPVGGGPTHAVVLEAIAPAENAWDAWRRAPDAAARAALLCRLTATLAAHHTAGVMQTDLHQRNFLCADDRVYTLDGAGIREVRGALPRRPALEQLAVLLAQLGHDPERWLEVAYPTYAEARGWAQSPDDVALLRSLVRRAQERGLRERLRKVFRRSTRFAPIEAPGTRGMLDRAYAGSALDRLIADPDRCFNGDAIWLKRGGTAQLVLASLEGARVVVKRYACRRSPRGLLRALRPSRARRSWRSAQLLRFFDIATPQPVAFIERRRRGLTCAAYFIAEHIEAPTLRDVLRDESVPRDRKRALVSNALALLDTLRRVRVAHGDMKATNLLVRGDELLLTDLDSMWRFRNAGRLRRAHERDRRRFARNAEEAPALAELLEACGFDAPQTHSCHIRIESDS
jgi:tRNA A-37 threonylcarbamoyl transferase component Bud32